MPPGVTAIDFRGELRWLWKYALPAAPILAVVVYGVLRQLYASFYGTLGASPEEVGLGYQAVLALSGVALLVFVLLTGAFFLLRFPGRRMAISTMQRRALSILAPVLSVLVLIAGMWWLYDQTQQSAARAYQGEAVTSVNVSVIQVLGLRAEPALIQWLSKPPNGQDILAGHCLMYLGTADGVDVFFDPGPGFVRTIRLQASAINVTVYRGIPAPGGGFTAAACAGGQVKAGAASLP